LTLQKKIDDIIIDFEEIAKQKPDSIDSSIAKMEDITKKAVGAAKEAELLTRMHKEVQKMKIGSIALVSQIRTISKIRIYDPKTNHDVLSNVKLSNEKLDLIDTEIIHNFTGQR
jgi:hypothetical protein